MARTLTFQNQIRSTTSGIEFIDDLDLNQAQILIEDEGALDDPAQVSGTIIYDLNFIRTAVRDIKGGTPTYSWFDSTTTSGLISLADTRTELSVLQEYIGSAGDGDNTPAYSSTVFISPTADLTEAVGQLDAALTTVSGATPLEIQKRVLIKSAGGHHPKNTTFNIDSPGAEWEVSGDSITIPDVTTFMESVSFFVNGSLLLNGENAAADRDVYFVASDHEVAFESHLNKRTVIQIWKFPPT